MSGDQPKILTLVAALSALLGACNRGDDSQSLLRTVREAAQSASERHQELRFSDVFGDDLSAICVFIDESFQENVLRRESDSSIAVDPIIDQIRYDVFMPSDESSIYVVDRTGRVRERHLIANYGVLFPLGNRTRQACMLPNTTLEFEDRLVPDGKAYLTINYPPA